MATPIAPIQSRWLRYFPSETVASDHVSAARYRGSKNIDILPIIVAELEFCNVKRQVFLADFMISADDTALQDAPEALNCVGVHCADNVFTLRMLDDLVRIHLLHMVVADPFVSP